MAESTVEAAGNRLLARLQEKRQQAVSEPAAA